MMRFNVPIFVMVITGMLLAAAISPVSALTIIRQYVAPGEQFESMGAQVTAGQPPTNTVGGGNLVDVFNAAADAWERTIRDDHTVTVQFGWSPIPLGSGVHNVLSQGGVPNRVTNAIVYFDNDRSTKWFLDPTPRENSEYPTVTECFTSFGGGRVNSGRVLSSGVGAAQALDLLTIAKHEIGHAVGLSTWNMRWASKKADQGVHIKAPRPFPGSMIPTGTQAHLTVAGSLMDGALVTGQRKLISVVDALVIAEMGEFVQLHLNPESVVLDTVDGGC